MEKETHKRKWLIAFVILLSAQFIYMLYWGNAKGGYYVDEFFTFDNAHYMSESTPERQKLYDDIIEYDKWIPLSEVKDTLMVNREESLLQDSFLYNMEQIVSSKPYMVLLNYIETIFFDGVLNKWSGISLNLVFYLLSQILIYKIAMKMTQRQLAALWAMALYGFSGLVISMVIYVRFYVLVNLWMLCFLYLHFLMWEENKWYRNLIYECLAAVVLILAYGNSPLAVIMGVGIMGAFTLMLIFEKRWRQMLYYLIPYGVGGLAYVFFFTDYLDIFMHAQEAANGQFNVATASLMSNLLNLTPGEIVSRTVELLMEINDYLFGHIFVLLIYVILSIIGLISLIKHNVKKRDTGILFGYVFLTIAIIFFSIASICFNLGAIRYNSFLYPLIALLVTCLAWEIGWKNEGVINIVLVGIVLANIGVTVTVPRIENLYAEDKQQVQQIRQYEGIPSIVVDYHFDDRVMYECLAYGDEETEVMFRMAEGIEFQDEGDKILVWQTVNRLFEVEEQLKEAGYTRIEKIAQTHESLVYICEKSDIKPKRLD